MDSIKGRGCKQRGLGLKSFFLSKSCVPQKYPLDLTLRNQPAGQMEAFFRQVSTFKDLPSREQAVAGSYPTERKIALHRLFGEHGMDLLGPPLIV
jgi:hypothetical protein